MKILLNLQIVLIALAGCSWNQLVITEVFLPSKEVILKRKGSANVDLGKEYFVYRMVIGESHDSASQTGETCTHDANSSRSYRRKVVGRITVKRIIGDGILIGEILEGDIQKGDIVEWISEEPDRTQKLK